MSISRCIPVFVFFLTFAFSCKDQKAEKTITHAAIPDKIDFNFHVKPILSDRCYKCHGPDENARQANLRLDLEEFAFAPLDSSAQVYAIVPRDPKNSQLIHRINSSDPEELMPPPESNLSLSSQEIAILKRWIQQGAEWKPHWSFIAPEKPVIPDISTAEWSRNPIDNFIQKRLEAKGLKASAAASKEKLIRRVSFDLRGLPPDLEEINAFVGDNSPNAYEKLVDRFLAAESYGERLAQDWLDLARYADSHGYQDDLERSMWPWRDWVIKAFNNNMPYDQFVSWQLAGDLLPNASYEQKLATAFNRNHKITQEVGVVDEEYRVEYVLDRVNTVSTAFLGLTVACAQCHDHKFDPISQKEYYSLFSFFNNVPEAGRVEYNVEVAEPSLPLPEEKAEKIKSYITSLVRTKQEEVTNFGKQLWTSDPDYEKLNIAPGVKANPLPSGLTDYYSFDLIEDNTLLEESRNIKKARVVNGLVPIQGKYSGGLEFSGKNHLLIPAFAGRDLRQAFTLSCWIYSIDGGISGPILVANSIAGSKAPRLEFAISGNKTLQFSIKDGKPKNVLSVYSKREIPENRWLHLSLSYDGSGLGKGVKMYFDGEELELIIRQEGLPGLNKKYESIWVGSRRSNPNTIDKGQKGLVAAQLDEVMIFKRKLSLDEIKNLLDYNPLATLQSKAIQSERDKRRLFYHHLFNTNKDFQQLTQRLREYKIREVRMEEVILKPTMIMADMDSIRPSFVLDRGQYNAPTERVYVGTPARVLPFPDDYPKNRLGLAQWLFDPANPLTARVAVNHYWQMIFGRGLVATPEDFGSQGELPSHPELLDWLAITFRESGWDIKQLLKLLLMSSTYQQTASIDPQLQQLDPENILLARGAQSRLSSEMIRDHALSISGLLSPQIGGPSVKPYQPAGLWLEVSSGNQPLRKYIQDHGHELYRRSIYTFWKRTAPPPSMMSFDASTREQCSVRRSSTSTPMQALVLLNDPQFTEASRLIAERMLREGGSNAKDRIQLAFRLATSRRATDEELSLLLDLLDKKMQVFKAHPGQAENLLAIGEYPLNKSFDTSALAAYTIIANTILNLTEAIWKS